MRTTASIKPDCPTAPPSRRSVVLRTIHAACVLLGGIPALAARFSVPEPTVRHWLEGEVAPPEAVFLDSLEILLLSSEQARGKAS
jgi:hypothetical protein